MKAPWAGRTGAAKIAVWSATVLGISLGLCGANFAAVWGIAAARHDWGWASVSDGVSFPLIITAYLEVGGMLVGAVGLLVAVVVWLWELVTIVRKERNPE